MLKLQLILILSIITLSGCGELSYKMGATPRDLEMAKKKCQEASTEAAAKQCLENKGWVVQQLDTPDALDLFATTSVTDNRTGKVIEPTTDSSKSGIKTGFIDAEKTETTPVLAEKVTEPSAKEIKVMQKNNTPNEEAPKPAPNPLDTFKINSWWKMGAGRVPLEADIKSCATKLGAEHEPDNKTQTMTRAMILCMKDKGWSALRAK